MRQVIAEKLEQGRVRNGPWASDSSYGLTGAFRVFGPCGAELHIVAGAADDPSADAWEHVSVSTARRCPNWEEMCWVKDMFWKEDEVAVQIHPPKSDYDNNHAFTLHLWRCTKTDFPLPPSIFVGIKEDGTYKNAADAKAGFERAKAKGIIK